MAFSSSLPTDRTLGWRWAAVLWAATLGLRLAYLPTAAADPTFAHPFLDALWNLQHASAVAHGHLTPPHPFYRAPLYTYALGAALAVTGGSVALVHLLQLALGGLTAVLVGTLGARLFGRPVGVLAGLLYGMTATIALFDFEFVNAAVFVPLVVLTLLALDRAARAPSLPSFLAAGGALGIAALARPDILVLAPVAVLVAVVASRRAGWRGARTAAACGVLAGALVLVIAPATAYNAIVGRDAILISSEGGPIFYICNNPRADGLAPVMPGPTNTASYAPDGTYTDNIESSSRYLAGLALGHPPKPSEVSRYWVRRALAWIASDPIAWGKLLARRAFYLVGGFEIGDQKNLAYFLESWWPFTFLPRWWWLLPLAMAGLTVAGELRGRLLLAAFAVAYGAVLVLFVPVERFRLALYPAACILAARFVMHALAWARSHRWRALAPRLALVAVLAVVLCLVPTGYTRHDRAEAAVARASASARHGDAAEAERLYLEALSLEPDSSGARAAYAAFLAAHGRPAEARAVGGPTWRGKTAP